MQVDIAYGPGTMRAELPDRTMPLANAPRRTLPPVGDLKACVAEALADPLDMPPVGELVGPTSRVTIAFDDPTVLSFGPVRQTVIAELLRQIEAAGAKRSNVTLVCANALHRKFRTEELARILGPELVREFGERLICHDAEDKDNMVHLGKTPQGHDVEVNRLVAESDLTVYINAAHNRGFMGGWKSICVGLSGYRSIRHHHTPTGMTMSIEKNRMHKMLDEMGRVVESKIAGRIFKVDTILSNPFEVARIFAGSVGAARAKTMEVMKDLYPARRELAPEKYDVILYSVPAVSPYAVFSYMNPLLTLVSSGLGYVGGTVQAMGKPGCTVVMVTPCPDVWDTVHHASYPDVWKNVLTETRDPWEIMERFAERYATHEGYIEKYRNEFAFHPVHGILATYPLARLKHCGRVIVVGPESPEVVRHLGFEPVGTVEEALGLAADLHGADYSIGYVEHGVVSKN